jgi:1,4-alpha-glucan branching enzyme
VIAFVRRSGVDALLIVANYRNDPYFDGYVIQSEEARLPSGLWREVFNSDASEYGGWGIGNYGADVSAEDGRFQARLPACGLLVFWKSA